VEELFGLRGDGQTLRIAPQLPSHWQRARVWRRLRGADFEVEIERVAGRSEARVAVDGRWLEGDAFSGIEAGRRYRVRVELPSGAVPT
jgi:cellobionic acid phosphorylase